MVKMRRGCVASTYSKYRWSLVTGTYSFGNEENKAYYSYDVFILLSSM